MKGKRIVAVLILVCLFCGIVAASVYAFVWDQQRKDIAFTIKDTLPNGNGQSAKVVLLAGQSNASGCSVTSYLQKNLSSEKFAELKNGYDNLFINYFASGNNLSDGFVKTSVDQGESGGHFGPEVGLAEKLHALYPDQTVFIIKFAWGGTDLFSQWLSPSSGETGFLYRNFVRYVKQSMEYLFAKGYDPVIEGVCWMQGESDSFSVENGIEYETRLKNFIADLRKDLSSYASKDGIAFVDALIADNPVFWVYCDLVNRSKLAVAASVDNAVVIDTNAQGLRCDEEPTDKPDIPHYDSLSQLKLGNLFGEEVARFFD